MKKKTLLIIAGTLIISMFFLSACGSNEEKENYDKELNAYWAKSSEELMKEYVKDKDGKATEEEFTKLLESSKYFKKPGANSSDDFKIPDNYDEVLAKIEEAGGYCNTGLAEKNKLYESEHTYTRCYAIFCIGYGKASTEKKLEIFNKIMKEEKEPAVKIQLMKTMTNYTSHNSVMKYYLKCAKDKNKKVREISSHGLISSLGKTSDRVKLAKTLLADKEIRVRSEAAAYAGQLHEHSLVKPLTELLNSGDSEAESQAARGLCAMWTGNPNMEYSNKEAYESYMDFIEKSDKNVSSPDSFVITACLCHNMDREKWNSLLDNTGFFNRDKFLGLMKELVENSNTGYSVKNSAMRVIGQYGTKDDLEGLRDTVEKWDNPNRDNLMDTLNDTLEEWESTT